MTYPDDRQDFPVRTKSRCSEVLRAAGEPYPRTCAEHGLVGCPDLRTEVAEPFVSGMERALLSAEAERDAARDAMEYWRDRAIRAEAE